jgi:hypothetical protein
MNEKIGRAHFKLTLLLAAYDRAQSEREQRRGWVPNMGRLPILLEAAQNVVSKVEGGDHWLDALRDHFELRPDGKFFLSPVNRFVKWLAAEQYIY